jgi:hypothetical protein
MSGQYKADHTKMLSKTDKKEAIRKFKEQKTLRGAFAVRCTASGRVWVGSSLNLGSQKNSLWFALRVGKHLQKSLQEEWNVHGEPAFAYEILEQLDDDAHPLGVADLLKKKKAHWIVELGALPV